MIRILLADSRALVRQGLRVLLEREEDFTVVGEVASGLALCSAVGEARPHVVVLDLVFPEISGLELTRQIREYHPGVRVIILSRYFNAAYVRNALESGASGYLRTRCGAKELAVAVRLVAEGHRYLSPALDNLEIADEGTNPGPADPYSSLTTRERQVLGLAAHGLNNHAVGSQLQISPRTVEIHRASIRNKLGLRTHKDLRSYALSRGVLAATPGTGAAASPHPEHKAGRGIP